MAKEISSNMLQMVVDQIINVLPVPAAVEMINQQSIFNIEFKYEVIKKLKSIKNEQKKQKIKDIIGLISR